jgi:hypothetical protein
VTGRLALLTCSALPEPDPDEESLVRALADRGIEARLVAWNGPDEPGPLDLAVLRSTWDYHHDPEAFRRFCARLALRAPLWNPLHLVTWNLRKTYLRELKERGVPVVPTAWMTVANREPLRQIARERGWTDLVLKPQVGAASHLCRRFRQADWDEAERWIDEVLPQRALMVQPYIADVEDRGERSLVWIDGALTHAVRKSPRLMGGHEAVSDAVEIDEDERVLAEVTLRPFAGRMLYARVDVVRGAGGVPMVMELELIEPSLFLRQWPPALHRLVDGIVGRMGG